jgi:Domain of unknown function (DUF4145)
MSIVTPALGLRSFCCPTCKALASQAWYRLYGSYCTEVTNPKPVTVHHPDQIEALVNLVSNRPGAPDAQETARRINGLVYFGEKLSAHHNVKKVENLYLSQCFSCKDFAIWQNDNLLFPLTIYSHEPHADMPINIRSDFTEASNIVNNSPRGACALLRLCVQKLLIEFGYKGKRINDDIATMVKDGVAIELQQAFDIVRLIGNDAVHPGEIDLKDDVATANKLFTIVNYIVEEKIGKSKRIAEIYGSLPTRKIEEIERRDGRPNSSEDA